MAQAKECDRCGKLYKPYIDGNPPGEYNAVVRVRVNSRGDILYSTHPVDLCEECMNKIRKFLVLGEDFEEDEQV